MRQIELTRGHVATVDDEDYYWLNQFKWFLLTSANGFKYAATGRRAILMHRLIMKTPEEMVVDHIDHDTLNNQKSNLRNCTFSNNSQNTKPRKCRVSKYKGITKQKSGRWKARIQVGNERIHIGVFDTDIKAAQAYDKAAIKYFGEFALVNFPGPFDCWRKG